MKLYYNPGGVSLAAQMILHEGGIVLDGDKLDILGKRTAYRLLKAHDLIISTASIIIFTTRQRSNEGLRGLLYAYLFRLIFVFCKNYQRSKNTKCHEDKTKLLCNCHEPSILPVVEPGRD